ncbi:MAG: histidine--tRNA ligase [Candidatus Omnitrophota bacterium]|nr:histidine--tRNA ligase [Candidatus Omnitrophota bacterium]
MIKALRGTKDILPEDIGLWKYIEATGRDIFNIYGYNEIRTPVIEEASLFIRSIGDATDIVQKEMYVFSDRGGRNIALRPEATASIVRAYLENPIFHNEGLVKLFYTGPMFRAERPQQGRQRQFHQIGVEAIGSDSPFIDAEVIAAAVKFLEKLGIKKFHVKLNSLGCQKDKASVMEKHKESFRPHLEKLCADCKGRFEKNVLRIFDCKEDTCKAIAENVKTESALCSDCAEHFKQVKHSLDLLGVKYIEDQRIVRGLDYYTKTVFEITQEDLGAKDAICAGGRYNNLVKELGGKDTPAIGFAFGVERLVLALAKPFSLEPITSSANVFIAVAGDGFYEEAFKILDSLRSAGVVSEMDFESKSLKAQMRRAEKLGAKFTVIVGEEEFKKGKVILRDMEKRDQKEIDLRDLDKEFRK